MTVFAKVVAIDPCPGTALTAASAVTLGIMLPRVEPFALDMSEHELQEFKLTRWITSRW
jgi:hypothetical protein